MQLYCIDKSYTILYSLMTADTRYASSLLLEDVRPEVVPSVSNRESVTECVRPVSEELSYSPQVSGPLSEDPSRQQLISAEKQEQENKGEDG